MNLPNKITLARVAMVPIFAVLALAQWPFSDVVAAIVFAVAGATDALDGWLARSRGLVSNFGKFMDPLADKMLVMTALIILVSLGRLPAWVFIIIICRDLAVDGLRLIAAERGTVIAASRPAKMKTTTQMLMVIVLLLETAFSGSFMHIIGLILVYVALALTVYSGCEYLYKGREFFK